jgi:hypothetical protein
MQYPYTILCTGDQEVMQPMRKVSINGLRLAKSIWNTDKCSISCAVCTGYNLCKLSIGCTSQDARMFSHKYNMVYIVKSHPALPCYLASLPACLCMWIFWFSFVRWSTKHFSQPSAISDESVENICGSFLWCPWKFLRKFTQKSR